MDATQLTDLKKQRSSLKTDITKAASRLQRGIVKKAEERVILSYVDDLSRAYHDFDEIDEEYTKALQNDETNQFEAFRTVNGFDLFSYTQSVEDTYSEAKKAYDEYTLAGTADSFKQMSIRLGKLWSKIENSINPIQIEKDLERVKEVVKQLSPLVERQKSHGSADWNNLISIIEETLQENEEKEDAVNERMRGQIVQPTPPSATLPASTSAAATTAAEPTVTLPASTSPTTTQAVTTSPTTTQAVTISAAATTAASPSPAATPAVTTSPATTSLIMTPAVTTPPVATISGSSSLGGSHFSSLPGMSPITSSSAGYPLYLYTGYNSLLQAPMSPAALSLNASSVLQPTASSFVPSDVKVRRAELPFFSGKRRDWPEFKTLWPKMAVPAFHSRETLASELRRCCERGDAKRVIENISIVGPEACDVMWQRLVDHYEDAAASVNEIMRTLQGLRAVKVEDYRYLTEFVNVVESCYTQLAITNHLNCISILDVDSLSRLLPVAVKEGWYERHQGLTGEDQLHPFKEFTRYLIEKRRAVSRLAESQPVAYKKKEVSTHSGSVKPDKKPYAQKASYQPYAQKAVPNKPRCAVHKDGDGKHSTENCRVFQEMSRDDRLSALKSVYSCFRCFRYHPRGKCSNYKDACEKCGKTGHHTLLCLQHDGDQVTVKTGSSSSNTHAVSATSDKVSTEAHTTQQKSAGLYAIFSVPVRGSKRRCTVFADDGSDSSYITNAAAGRLGARKLNTYLLEVTTTGGLESEFESQEYELDIITRSGKIATIRMFSMNKITGPISKLNLPVIDKLFPDYDTTVLQRDSPEVDVLLGSDYFGLHPKKEICTAGENLSIMEGALGVCLQGSHPLLRDCVDMDSNMVKVLKAANIMTVAPNHSFMSVKHPIFEAPVKQTQCHFNKITSNEIHEYIRGEEIGTHTTPKCGSCRCGKCPLPGHTFSFQEEVELKLVREGLEYNDENQCWISKYPWKFDPYTLPDNYSATLATLNSLERKLQKDDETAQIYQSQMVDMIERKAARKLSAEELSSYTGPAFYISHLGVLNPRSKSTPFRIVFNSSQLYKGISLNNFLYKGPDAYMNNQLGVLIRWRENRVAIVGDIKKMFNSVHLKNEEQHCHRFLWRDLKYGEDPDVYCMTVVNMGDRPAGTISTEAIYMTAEKFQLEHPQAAQFLKIGSYVDDLLESVSDKEEAERLTIETESLLVKGGFKIKYWLKSGESSEDGETQVLGVSWISESDSIVFHPSLNFSPKKQGVHILPDLTADEVPAAIPEILTKRMVLGQVMRIYDPMGFICPFTLQGKILLRDTWEAVKGWDDPLQSGLRSRWIKFLCAVYELSSLKFPRSIKPEGVTGDPTLVLLSDASDKAYGVVAYARWSCGDGTYTSRLILAKNRISPLVKRSTPQLELNAAVLSKRAREVVEKEMRYKFVRIIHLIDSETVLAMLHKTSTRFKLYEGVRVGEIQAATNGDVSCWAWIPGRINISDWLTRGKDPAELSDTSEWFRGPSFMSDPEDTWELKYVPTSAAVPLPGEKKVVYTNSTECRKGIFDYRRAWTSSNGSRVWVSAVPLPEKKVTNTNSTECRKGIFAYHRVSKYSVLLGAVSRVKNVFRKKSFFAMSERGTPKLLEEAEIEIIKDVQRLILHECEKKDAKGRSGGCFYRLKPVMIGGVWVVGTRLVLNPLVPENEPQKLLPTSHSVTTLLMKEAHHLAIHGGRDATLAKFRHRYWILQGSKVAMSMVQSCLLCKLRIPKLISQKMGMLPPERSQPAPAFTYTMVDYFGPYKVRGEVQKRISGKAWGVIFTDMVSRAVFIEAVYDYSAASFLLALSNFANIRGYPAVIYSDCDPKLTCSSNQLDEQWRQMWKEEGQKITDWSTQKGLEWRFSSPDAPWMNGAVESLIKSVKKAISFSMQDQRLSPTEFSAALHDIANTLNERPLGTLTSLDSELSIITPNSLLMGRSRAKNPLGWQPEGELTLLQRFHIVQLVCDMFWRQWLKTCAPSLITDSKWHTGHRELQPGDVVLVVDSDAIRSEYRLALIKEVFRGEDDVVRKVLISYRHYKVGDTAVQYTGSREQCCIRHVNRLALIVPVE